MKTLAQRIKEKREEKGMSQDALAEEAGVSQPLIHKLESGKALETRKLTQIASALNVSPQWLATGDDEGAGPIRTGNTSPGPQTKGLIPLISWVAAGAWTAIEDPYEIGDAEKWMPCPVAHGNHTFALRVRGSSMEDEYRDGDIIYIDPSRRPENGSHIVVRLDDSEEATFKRLVMEGGDTYLEALNKSWPERVIKVNGNATIIGVVVFSGRER
ncbi:MAG: LexA family transcriptional regulator [Candidatus Sedimenticola sp. (ex Thyasira tokunagai)]